MKAITMFKLALGGWICALGAMLLLAQGYRQAKWIAIVGIAVGACAIACGAIANIAGKLQNDLSKGTKKK